MTPDTPSIDLPSQPQRRAHDRFVVGLVGGALLVASLAAAGGWLLRDRQSARELAPTPVSAAALPAPTDQRATAPGAAPTRDDEVAPPGPAPVRATPKPAPVATPPEQRRIAAAPARAADICAHCGTVESVRSFERKGEANGVGAVAGGVLGGVVGNQIGGGNGRKAMTVLGAIGGGLAGHEIEKRARSETMYEVRVRLDDGSVRTVTQKTAPAQGSRVVLEGGALRNLRTNDETTRRVYTNTAS